MGDERAAEDAGIWKVGIRRGRVGTADESPVTADHVGRFVDGTVGTAERAHIDELVMVVQLFLPLSGKARTR